MPGGRPLTKWLRLRLKKRQNDRARSAVAANDETKPVWLMKVNKDARKRKQGGTLVIRNDRVVPETRPNEDTRKRKQDRANRKIVSKLNKDAQNRKQGGTHLICLENQVKSDTKPSYDTRKRMQDRGHRTAAFQSEGRPGTNPPNITWNRKQDQPISTTVEDKLKPRTKPSKGALPHASNENASVSSSKHISVIPVHVASKSSQAPSPKRIRRHLDVKIIEDSSILDSVSRAEHDRVSQFKGMFSMLASCVSCKYENEFNDEELTFETDTFYSKTLGSTTLGSSAPTRETQTLDSQTSDSSRSGSSSSETSNSTEPKPSLKVESSSYSKETWARFPATQDQSLSFSSSLKKYEEPSRSKISEDEPPVRRVRPSSVGFIPIHEGGAVNIIMAHSSSDMHPKSRSVQEDWLEEHSSTGDHIDIVDSSPKKKDLMVSPRLSNRREWSTLTPLSFVEKSASSEEYYNNDEDDEIWKFDTFMQQGEPWMGW